MPAAITCAGVLLLKSSSVSPATQQPMRSIILGGRMLDGFENFLPDYYAQFGFQETGRAKFDSAQAPANWNPKDGRKGAF
jgi:hypothetical protein